MKRILCTLLFLAPLYTASLAQAQLVHFALQGTVIDKFGGSSWWNGAGSGVGAPVTLDITYNSDVSPLPNDPFDPVVVYPGTSSTWRLRFGQLDVSSTLESITVSDTSLWAHAFSLTGLTTLDLQLKFAGDPSAGLSLPTPPFPPLAPPAVEEGDRRYASTFTFDTLNAGNLGEGSITVGIDRLSVDGVPPTGAVPESSTYALGALALAVAIVARRKLNAQKARS